MHTRIMRTWIMHATRNKRTILLAAWIFGTAAYFYGRFSWVVYKSHEAAIDKLFDRIFS